MVGVYGEKKMVEPCPEENARPIAPTPPASPVSRFSEGSEVLLFSAHGSPLEVLPTAEDHILCSFL